MVHAARNLLTDVMEKVEAHLFVSNILSGIMEDICTPSTEVYLKCKVGYSLEEKKDNGKEKPHNTMAPRTNSDDKAEGGKGTWVLPKITITYYCEPREDRKRRRGELINEIISVKDMYDIVLFISIDKNIICSWKFV